ncbi:MAG: periplasmic sensor signal transduction histidine kinase [Myxococcaceae bacterium]|nr:periplasmic sensor signal transduction histidine kinase [Myxococcaceae bacterium]MEA2752465.1 two-component system, OmpR family, sensor kinase [Myxococcales bacterium]
MPPFVRMFIPSRLALRIYLIGILQFLVVAAAMEIDHRAHRPTPPWTAQGEFVADGVARVIDDPVALQAEIDRIARLLSWTVDVRDGEGHMLAHAGLQVDAAYAAQHPLRVSPPIAMRDGRKARLEYTVHAKGRPPVPPWLGFPGIVAFFVVGIAAMLTARSLARPLQRLAGAARAFGAGSLDVRADMKRSDEIGEVAKAFDDMAARIGKLLQTERELLANVSHELRTPLARIRVALDLANEADPRDVVASIAEIAQDLAELERIVDDVLSSARLALDASSPNSRPAMLVRAERLDTRTLLEKSVSRFQAAHPKRPLEVHLAKDLPDVMADAVLLRRVIDNLLDNAHKYTDEPAKSIALEARRDGDEIVIEVQDHGIGIDEADLERLFEPFFRADRSRTRATGGLGLGLALARRVVDAHRGTIGFTSEVGEGTVVRVRLPAAA